MSWNLTLKAVLLEAKKDARLTPAATFAGADIGMREVRIETCET